MVITDLKIGEIYAYNFQEWHHIFVLKELNKEIITYKYLISFYIAPKKEYRFNSGGSTKFDSKCHRQATEQEKEWLLQSIKAKKLIPKNEINFNPIHEIW